jgi:hypothetical protein
MLYGLCGIIKAMALDVAMQGPKLKSSTRKMPLVKEPWHPSDLERKIKTSVELMGKFNLGKHPMPISIS